MCGVPTEVLWALTSPDLSDHHQLNDDGLFRKSSDVVAGGTTRSSLTPLLQFGLPVTAVSRFWIHLQALTPTAVHFWRISLFLDPLQVVLLLGPL